MKLKHSLLVVSVCVTTGAVIGLSHPASADSINTLCQRSEVRDAFGSVVSKACTEAKIKDQTWEGIGKNVVEQILYGSIEQALYESRNNYDRQAGLGNFSYVNTQPTTIINQSINNNYITQDQIDNSINTHGCVVKHDHRGWVCELTPY